MLAILGAGRRGPATNEPPVGAGSKWTDPFQSFATSARPGEIKPAQRAASVNASRPRIVFDMNARVAVSYDEPDQSLRHASGLFLDVALDEHVGLHVCTSIDIGH